MNPSPLVNWFRQIKRDLPWRTSISPYSVWISEMMLQQTQVKTVIPYFERWMIKFPDLQTLASSSIEEVIKLWEGLGYYSRARYIHESAKKLIQEGFKEITPDCLDLIKGLGPYTKGAILSFAFHQREAAVDGNVLRVMSRLTLYEEDIGLPSSRKDIENKVLDFLPKDKPWEAMEALIELGAIICKKTPDCLKCPLLSQCQAYRTGRQLELPKKKKGIPITKLVRTVFIIESKEGYLVKKESKGKIMADLYEFPWIEGHPEEKIQQHIETLFGKVETLTKLSIVSHSFTRYSVKLHPYKITINNSYKGDYEWKKDLSEIPFSSGHRRISHIL